jgi:hypothetical protein
VRPRPGLTWYNGSKGAAIVTSRSMAAELARDKHPRQRHQPGRGETLQLADFMGEDTPQKRAQSSPAFPSAAVASPSDHRDRCGLPRVRRSGVHHRRLPRGRRRPLHLMARPSSRPRTVLKPERGPLTLLLGALIALAPLAMDVYLASMPSMTTALRARPSRCSSRCRCTCTPGVPRSSSPGRSPIASGAGPR